MEASPANSERWLPRDPLLLLPFLDDAGGGAVEMAAMGGLPAPLPPGGPMGGLPRSAPSANGTEAAAAPAPAPSLRGEGTPAPASVRSSLAAASALRSLPSICSLTAGPPSAPVPPAALAPPRGSGIGTGTEGTATATGAGAALRSCRRTRARSSASASSPATVQPRNCPRHPIHISEVKYEHWARWSEMAHTSVRRKAARGDGDAFTSTPFLLSFLMHLARNLW